MTEEPEAVQARNTVDVILRTTQQSHTQISVMADTKANIVITISSIVLTLTLSRMGDPTIRPAILTLTAFTLGALLLAVLTVLPQFHRVENREGEELPQDFNLLFFGHFTTLSLERYQGEMRKILKDDGEIYDAAIKDIYEQGQYLQTKKYAYLRYSYLSLLIGFVAAFLIQVGSIALG